jgi:hypothetical protein
MICPECDRVCAPLATSDAKAMSNRLYHVPTTRDADAGAIIDAANLLLAQSHRVAELEAELKQVQKSRDR